MSAVNRVHDRSRRERVADARDRGDAGALEIGASGDERLIQIVARHPHSDDDQRAASEALFRAAVHIRERDGLAIEARHALQRVNRHTRA